MADDVTDAKEFDERDKVDARGQARIPLVTETDFLSERYNMGHSSRGIALIINNMDFKLRSGLERRSGSIDDETAICGLLGTLGFKNPICLRDLTVSDMKKRLYEVAKQDHTNSDCFVCFILSHGDEGYVYGTDNKVPIDELVLPFKGHACPSLAGKPKLFFIQACKDKVTETVTDGLGIPESSGEGVIRRIPTEADFLMAYSVIPGRLSWKPPSKGSWFIQAVVDVFSKNWQTMDVMTMLTRVNRKVASDFETGAPSMFVNQNKQISYISCMLTKNLLFAR